MQFKKGPKGRGTLARKIRVGPTMLYTLSVAPYILNPFPGSQKKKEKKKRIFVIFKLLTEIIIDVFKKYLIMQHQEGLLMKLQIFETKVSSWLKEF